jgi:hypothetical protein
LPAPWATHMHMHTHTTPHHTTPPWPNPSNQALHHTVASMSSSSLSLTACTNQGQAALDAMVLQSARCCPIQTAR